MKTICIILIFAAVFLPSLSAKTKKKYSKTTTEAPEERVSQPAIIAIEIVDPNENSTNSRQSKRTIENALGYGYNSYEKPRYEIYKYSQHDIPPYRGDPSKIFSSSKTSEVNIQKAVQYTLPPITEQLPQSALKPGTTLYSSLSAQGQIGGLSSSLSNIPGLEQNNSPLPVVVLRIYPDQLKDSTIQANLPKSHPFAKSINSVNIQSLLLHYIKALQPPQSVDSSYSAPSSSEYTNYQLPHVQYQKQQQQQQQYHPRQNNYYQISNNHYSGYNTGNGVQVEEAPLKYEFRYQSSTPHTPTRKSRPAAPQYYYVQPTTENSYNNEQSSYQYYEQETHQPDYNQEQHTDYNHQELPSQYYSSGEEQQYQQYYQQPYVADEKLLTSENYPSNSHTRVVFKTDAGVARTPESDESAKEIKTIKIQVPENIAKVEVEESEQPTYNPYANPSKYSENQQNNLEQDYTDQGPSSPPSESYYADSVKRDYYNTQDRPAAETSFNYQNIDYDQMVRYFVRRGAMPKYFYQRPDAAEDDEQKSTSKGHVTAAYDHAAFHSTTESGAEKKTKKRAYGLDSGS
ncbi:myb-like protein Q [Euwallacea fornicatus]|uniref:myb-like protein Q n=1 Tax=Euwallacea fornicatus TaxID=995702 RepID=UPI00338E60BA